MKVKELIEVLKQFDENKQVDICGMLLLLKQKLVYG